MSITGFSSLDYHLQVYLVWLQYSGVRRQNTIKQRDLFVLKSQVDHCV